MSDLTSDATKIWMAGVDSVRAKPLVRREVRLDRSDLVIGDHRWSLEAFDRLLVVGAGKAGTAMAEGFLEAIGNALPVVGWVNVPEGTEKDLVEFPAVRIHAARPAGVNEPTAEGVTGTREILKLVQSAGPRDLCIALISGGGSALLPAPIEGITLADKLAVTRFLSGAGADITELNTVRKQLSSVKGGGLLKRCRAGHLATLVLSDVLGDPLDLIASGPTVPDTSTPEDALAVLAKFDPRRTLAPAIYQVLSKSQPPTPTPNSSNRCPTTTIVLGNNALAVDQAGLCAEELGYNHAMQSARQPEGSAEEVGVRLAEITESMLGGDHGNHRTDCLITGGEPTVTLAPPEQRGLGGRNQQLVLAAYQRLLSMQLSDQQWERLCLLSGGTDGEDGPTDAAGAFLSAEVHRRALDLDLDVADSLRRNDAYRFFQQAGGLLITGPTGTNVCDIRVVVVRAES